MHSWIYPDLLYFTLFILLYILPDDIFFHQNEELYSLHSCWTNSYFSFKNYLKQFFMKSSRQAVLLSFFTSLLVMITMHFHVHKFLLSLSHSDCILFILIELIMLWCKNNTQPMKCTGVPAFLSFISSFLPSSSSSLFYSFLFLGGSYCFRPPLPSLPHNQK